MSVSTADTLTGRARGFVEDNREYGIALFRIASGVLFLSHGVATLFGVLGKEAAAEFGAWPSWWAGAIQLVAGILVAVGVGVRGAALIASGSMAYAYFVVHQGNGLLPIENGGVSSALYAWGFFVLVFTGPGAWAVGTALRRRRPVPVES